MLRRLLPHLHLQGLTLLVLLIPVELLRSPLQRELIEQLLLRVLLRTARLALQW